MMKYFAAFAAFAFSGAVFAAAHTAAPAASSSGNESKTVQNSKMANCNKEASGKKGAERKAFMKTCLKGVSNATTTPQTKADKSKPAMETPKP